MATASELRELAARLKRCATGDQCFALVAAIDATPIAFTRRSQALRFADAGAYESAAALLVPENFEWCVGQNRPMNGGAWADVQPNCFGVFGQRAATPALALGAAALLAWAMVVEGDNGR